MWTGDDTPPLPSLPRQMRLGTVPLLAKKNDNGAINQKYIGSDLHYLINSIVLVEGGYLNLITPKKEQSEELAHTISCCYPDNSRGV